MRFDKDGYTTTYSQVVHVLPEWTDLNVGLGRIAPAAVTGLAMAADGSEIDLSFDTWMKVRSIEQQVSVRGHGRDRVKGQLVALDPQPAPDGTMLSTRFAFRPDHGFHGPDVTLVVGGDALDYAGVPLGSSASQTFSLAPGRNDDQHDRGLAAGRIEDDRLRV